jgi:hypothetical protein
MSCYYVGLDVHKASICIAILNPEGKLVMESVIETSASTILDSLKGLRGQVEVTFEEGTHAAWLYDVLHNKTKARIIVCDPRKNRLLQDGNKSDKVDARNWLNSCAPGCSRRFIMASMACVTSRSWCAATSTWSRTRPAP